MQKDLIQDIQSIAQPYADTWEDVQGPGGNVSVKNQEEMLIKASGFTFQDMCQGTGFVWLDHLRVMKDLAASHDDGSLECAFVPVIQSIPTGLRPSMEFEFHAVLGKYVLHTHSIYVNVITCCKECVSLLSAIFGDIPYVFVPYIMPGHPLASYIYKKVASGEHASIYFLKNHGIIVHAARIDEVLSLYHLVQQRIIDFLHLPALSPNLLKSVVPKNNSVSFDEISHGANTMAVELIQDQVLVPDQSIFFRNKISAKNSVPGIYFDLNAQKIVFHASPKFIQAAVSMLHMIYYILARHEECSLNSEFISKKELDVLHGLSSEKYRVSIL